MRNRIIVLRAILSFLAAVYINIGGHLDLIPKAIVSLKFYAAFIASFLISYGILFLVHYANNKLDRGFPWKNWLIRSVLQIVFGVAVPALFDLVLIFLFFMITGSYTDFVAFVKYDYLTVVLFIVAVNIVHQIPALLGLSKTKTPRDPLTLHIKHNGADVLLNVESDILYIYKDIKNVKIMTISGNEYSKKDSISKLMEIYAGTPLCLINQSAIVNLNMLKGYQTGTRSKTLDLLFKPQFSQVIAKAKFEKLYVTREFIQTFKAEHEKNKAE